jgi:hypothetical protein
LFDSATPSMRDAVLLRGDAGVENAVGHRAHELVEHAHDDRPVALQFLDHAHAVDELVALALQVTDFLYLLVELAMFLLM